MGAINDCLDLMKDRERIFQNYTEYWTYRIRLEKACGNFEFAKGLLLHANKICKEGFLSTALALDNSDGCNTYTLVESAIEVYKNDYRVLYVCSWYL